MVQAKPVSSLETFLSTVTALTDATVKAKGKAQALVDAAIAAKVTSGMLSLKKDDVHADAKIIASVKAAVLAAYSKADQTLIKADAKGLSEAQKLKRKGVQQALGSSYSKVQDALRKAEKAAADKAAADKAAAELAAMDAEERAEAEAEAKIAAVFDAWTKKVKVLTQVQDWIASQEEAPEGLDLAECKKRLGAVIGQIQSALI
jgi:colicin import membrane protein